MSRAQSQPKTKTRASRQPADKAARRFLPIPQLTEKEQERFEAFIDRSPGLGPGGDCHEWRGALTGENYPSFALRGKTFHAHRVALRITLGEDFPDKLACHRCDHPRCVRAAHLFAGTAKENLDDARQKRRWNPPARKSASIDGQTSRTTPHAPAARHDGPRSNNSSGPGMRGNNGNR